MADEVKIRSVGLKKAYFGDVAASGMPVAMEQLARTFKGSATFNTEDDTDTDFYCEEEPSTPVETISSEAGLKSAKLSFLEWTNAVLVKVFGGSIKTAQKTTIEGKTYTVDKYVAPRDIVIIDKAVRLVSLHNVVIDIPKARVKARFEWNLTRTEIAKISITLKALAPDDPADGPYSIYKLGEPDAGE